MWKEKGSKWFCQLFSLSPSCFVFALLVCFAFMFWVGLLLCIHLSCLTCFCLVTFQFCFIFYFHIKIKIKIEKSEKCKNNVCFLYIGTYVPWMAIEIKFSKFCIFCSLDEHLYAQLSKWALWLRFVMSKIKWSLVLNTRITLFDEKD